MYGDPLLILFGEKYYVSFIDDRNKFTWIYLLKHKSEVFTRHIFLPLKFCDEPFLAATYLINRTPSKIIDFPTPPESIVS